MLTLQQKVLLTTTTHGKVAIGVYQTRAPIPLCYEPQGDVRLPLQLMSFLVVCTSSLGAMVAPEDTFSPATMCEFTQDLPRWNNFFAF